MSVMFISVIFFPSLVYKECLPVVLVELEWSKYKKSCNNNNNSNNFRSGNEMSFGGLAQQQQQGNGFGGLGGFNSAGFNAGSMYVEIKLVITLLL